MYSMIKKVTCQICGKKGVVLPKSMDCVTVARRDATEKRYIHCRCNVSRATGNRERNENKKTANTKAHVLMNVSFDVENSKISGCYLDMNCFLRTGNHFTSFDFDNIQSLSKCIRGFNKRFDDGNGIKNLYINSKHLSVMVKNTYYNEHVTQCLQLLRKYEMLLASHNGIETKTVLNCKNKLMEIAGIE